MGLQQAGDLIFALDHAGTAHFGRVGGKHRRGQQFIEHRLDIAVRHPLLHRRAHGIGQADRLNGPVEALEGVDLPQLRHVVGNHLQGRQAGQDPRRVGRIGFA